MKLLFALLLLLPASTPARGADLHYTVSWIGNSFSGGEAGWVPQDVEDIFVTPDGTLYTTVGWEEHRGNIAAVKDGRILQQSAHWKRGGIDRLVGTTITADDRYIFFATGTPNGHESAVQGTNLARRDRADITDRTRELRCELGVVIHGVARAGAHLYAACADQRMRVFDLNLNELAEWPIPQPGELAAAPDSALWMVVPETGALVSFSPEDGSVITEFHLPSGVVPTDVAFTAAGELLIADGGPARQIHLYRIVNDTPEFSRSLGEKGGAFNGETPGRLGDWRLIAPIGVGADHAGNVYVACGPYAKAQGGTAIIQSYAPDDRLNWRVMSTEWLDTADFDRSADGAALFGSKHRYSLDLDQPPGREWALQAVTLNPDLFPEDPRLHSAAVGGVWHRVIDGHSFLFFPDMNGGRLFIYRFEPNTYGEIAIPCATIATDQIWIDRDANAASAPGEIQTNTTGETRGWFVEANGTVWQATRHAGIFAYPMLNISKRGVPQYKPSTRTHFEQPQPFSELRRIVYDRTHDAMYLGGSTPQAKAEHWKPMGPNLVKFEQWHAQPNIAWHRVLPHETAPGGHESFEPFDLAVEGDYAFIVYAGRLPSRNLPTGTVMILSNKTGEHVGHLQPSGNRTGTVPMDALQDIVHSINVYQRSDGEYLILIEDDGYTKNILYRWHP